MQDFRFAPSAQSNLFAMLTTEQQRNVADVFRHLKKGSQVALSYLLMDYIRIGLIPSFSDEDYFLETAFAVLTEYDMKTKSSSSIINPLI